MREAVEQGDVLDLLAKGAEKTSESKVSVEAAKPVPAKPRLPAYVQSM